MSYLNSAEVRAQVQEAHAEDQKVYDFVASTIYSRQVAAYRGNLELDLQELEQQKRAVNELAEPFSGNFMRNYVYKPLLHCRVM